MTGRVITAGGFSFQGSAWSLVCTAVRHLGGVTTVPLLAEAAAIAAADCFDGTANKRQANGQIFGFKAAKPSGLWHSGHSILLFWSA